MFGTICTLRFDFLPSGTPHAVGGRTELGTGGMPGSWAERQIAISHYRRADHVGLLARGYTLYVCCTHRLPGWRSSQQLPHVKHAVDDWTLLIPKPLPSLRHALLRGAREMRARVHGARRLRQLRQPIYQSTRHPQAAR